MSRVRSNPTHVRLYGCLNAVADVWLSHGMHNQALAGLSDEKGDLQLLVACAGDTGRHIRLAWCRASSTYWQPARARCQTK